MRPDRAPNGPAALSPPRGGEVTQLPLLRRCPKETRMNQRVQEPQLIGADDLEVPVDEDVVRPVDADVVDLVLAVAQLHDTVDDAPRVGGQRSFRRLIRCRSADDRPRPLTVVRRDLTDLL